MTILTIAQTCVLWVVEYSSFLDGLDFEVQANQRED